MLQIINLRFFYLFIRIMLAEGFDTVYYIIYICYIFVIIVLFHVVVCCRLLFVLLLLLFEISFLVLFQRGRYVTESAAEKKKIFDFRG